MGTRYMHLKEHQVLYALLLTENIITKLQNILQKYIVQLYYKHLLSQDV